MSEDMINPNRTKLGPQDFELKKVLGRGGYGKVFQVGRYLRLIIGGELLKKQSLLGFCLYL